MKSSIEFCFLIFIILFYNCNSIPQQEKYKQFYYKAHIKVINDDSLSILLTNPVDCPLRFYIDLSHTIKNGIKTYKGLPAPIICDFLSREESKKFYSKGAEFQIGKIEIVTNTGTYIDCPFHRYVKGKDTSEISLNKLVDVPAITVKVPYIHTKEITSRFFKNFIFKNKAVLKNTHWSKFWGTDLYFHNHPYLNKESAEFLRDKGALLVGIDSLNIDDTSNNSRPVHSILLGSEILIVEHLSNLHKLPKQNFHFSAIPPKLKGVGTFPVRAFAKI